MTETQAWAALGLFLTYLIGRAWSHLREMREERVSNGRWRAETLLSDGVEHVCETLYAPYVEATGALTDEQIAHLLICAERHARLELSFEGCPSLYSLLSPNAIGKIMRARLDRYVREYKKEES
jgi:hypothetical protein